jgi:protein gp37
MADVFEDRSELDGPRGVLWDLIRDTPHLDWLLLTKRPENIRKMLPPLWLDEPMWNVWLGTSVGDVRSLARLEHLRGIPAPVRWVSGEPLLEDLGQVDLRGIGWWVIGGESGSGARPMMLEWARRIVEQCRAASVPVFTKQFGSLWARGMTQLGHRVDPKGGDPSEWIGGSAWPREFPEVRP